MERQTYTIDAANQSLGRLASRIAKLLQGKEKAVYFPHIAREDFVVVKNVSKLKFNEKKFAHKMYYRHSGYPGGLQQISLLELFQKKPAEVLRRAVWGMLPKNKLRKQRMKRLKIEI